PHERRNGDTEVDVERPHRAAAAVARAGIRYRAGRRQYRGERGQHTHFGFHCFCLLGKSERLCLRPAARERYPSNSAPVGAGCRCASLPPCECITRAKDKGLKNDLKTIIWITFRTAPAAMPAIGGIGLPASQSGRFAHFVHLRIVPAPATRRRSPARRGGRTGVSENATSARRLCVTQRGSGRVGNIAEPVRLCAPARARLSRPG